MSRASPTFLQKFLLAFGGIALFVGIFVIANTLSITIAQRAREFGTLRTLGATRRQVLLSVILEAFVIGLLASIVGLFAGLGLAKGLDALFKSARHRPAAGGNRVRDAHDHRLARRRHRRDAARQPDAGDPRHARRADRSRPRGRRCLRRGLRASALRLRSSRLPSALALLLFGALDKSASGSHRLLAVGVGVAASCFVGHGAGRAASSCRRSHTSSAGRRGASAASPARSLATNATRNPAPNRVDGRGADDRARARHGGRRARVGIEVDLRDVGRQAVQRRLCADVRERVHADRGRVRACARQGSRCAGGLGRAGRRGARARAQHRHHRRGEQHRPRGQASPGSKAGRRCPPSLGTDGAFIDSDYAKNHDLSVGSPVSLLDSARASGCR